MAIDINQFLGSCDVCQQAKKTIHSKKNQEPLYSWAVPCSPWVRMHASLSTVVNNVCKSTDGCTEKMDDDKPTTDPSTNLQETSTGIHILESHMPLMGTGIRLLLLVGGTLALHWWFKRKEAKCVLRQGLFGKLPTTAPSLCHDTLPPPLTPPSFWMNVEADRFEKLLLGAVATDPHSSRPSCHPIFCHPGRGLAPP